MAARKRTAKKTKAAKPRRKAKVKRAASRETPTPKPVRRPVLRRRAAKNGVDETSRESFPASDPPSWTPVTGEKK